MKASSKGSFLKVAFSVSLLGFVGFAVTGYVGTAASAAAAPAAKEAATKKEAPKLDPKDPGSVIYLDTSGKPAGVGDPNRPPSFAYTKGHGWHPQALTGSNLPKDKFGLIDWARSVRENRIAPKPSLDPNDDEMPPLKMDVLIPTKSDFVDDVIYPHEMHTFWLKCEVCHPNIFIPQKGANNMTMVDITNGKFCGRCHNKIAFPLADCKRCHVSPKNASK